MQMKLDLCLKNSSSFHAEDEKKKKEKKEMKEKKKRDPVKYRLSWSMGSQIAERLPWRRRKIGSYSTNATN